MYNKCVQPITAVGSIQRATDSQFFKNTFTSFYTVSFRLDTTRGWGFFLFFFLNYRQRYTHKPCIRFDRSLIDSQDFFFLFFRKKNEKRITKVGKQKKMDQGRPKWIPFFFVVDAICSWRNVTESSWRGEKINRLHKNGGQNRRIRVLFPVLGCTGVCGCVCGGKRINCSVLYPPDGIRWAPAV